jgi:tetratricopeptide (TPR) repeat protein
MKRALPRQKSFSSALVIFAFVLIIAGVTKSFCETPQSEKSWKEYETAAKKAFSQNHFAEADHLLGLAAAEAEKFGTNDPRLSESLNERAQVCVAEQHFAEAEVLMRRAFAIDTRRLGTNDLQTAGDALQMGLLAGLSHRYDEAHMWVDQAQAAVERKGGRWSTANAICKVHHADLYMAENRFPEAEKCFREALPLLEDTQTTYNFHVMAPAAGPLVQTTWFPDPKLIAGARNDLGILYLKERKYSEADDNFKTAQKYCERQFGKKSPVLAYVLNNVAELRIAQHQFAEAQTVLDRAASLETALDPSDFRTLRTSNLRVMLKRAQGRPEDSAGSGSR